MTSRSRERRTHPKGGRSTATASIVGVSRDISTDPRPALYAPIARQEAHDVYVGTSGARTRPIEDTTFLRPQAAGVEPTNGVSPDSESRFDRRPPASKEVRSLYAERFGCQGLIVDRENPGAEHRRAPGAGAGRG